MSLPRPSRADDVLLFVDHVVLLATAFTVTCMCGAAWASVLVTWVSR